MPAPGCAASYCRLSPWPVLYESRRWKVTGSLAATLCGLTSQGSWFGNARGIVGESNPLNWAEGYVEAGVDAVFETPWADSSFYGRASLMGSATFGTDAMAETDQSALGMEDTYVGWRSGRLLGHLGRDALDVSVGGRDYHLCTGMLLWKGGIDGGDVGDLYIAPRQAFEFTTVVKLDAGRHRVELFYLVPHRARRDGTRTRIVGFDYEHSFGRGSKVGAAYIHVLDSDIDARDGLNVLDVRSGGSPVRGLDLGAEFACEFRGSNRRAFGGYGEVGYTWCRSPWKPRWSYRFAAFGGDDPHTARNEAFDSLYFGGSDLGTWYQGVVLGNFVTSNSNLLTHRFMLVVNPDPRWRLGVVGWINGLDEPGTFLPMPGAVAPTSRALAWELDFFADWKWNDRLSLSAEFGVAFPEAAGRQAFGGSDPWFFGTLTASLDF